MSATRQISRVLLVVVTVLSVLPMSACGGADARRLSHMERGQKYFAAGNLEKARVEFGNALQIAPNDADARFMSGRVAEKLGNIRAAMGLYQGAIDVSPDHIKARANLGRVYLFGNVPERAQQIIAPGLEKHPDDPDLLTVRAALRARSADAAGALEDAEKAVKLAPTNADAAALLSSLYREAGQSERAIQLLKTTLQGTPDSIDLRQVLVTQYLAADDPKAAEGQLLEIVKRKPQELRHRYELALFYINTKRPDDAERTFTEALAFAPEGSNEARLAYVDFLTTQRSTAQGEQALRDFIARSPRDYDLQLGLGALQQRSGSPQEAIKTYRDIIAKDGDGANGLTARDRIAAIQTAAGDFDDALKLLAEVLKKNPRDNDALTMRGEISLQRGDATAAISDLRAVIRDQPRAVPVLRALARAHLANGESTLAEENLRAAMEAAPADTSLRIEFAQLLSQTQRSDQGIGLLEETVRSTPKDVSARESLTRAYLAKGNFPAAQRSAEDLKTLRPDLALGPYLAGLTAQAQNRPEDAQHELEHALQLQPTAMDALAALARLQTNRGRRDAAIIRVESFNKQYPRNAMGLNLLAELQLAGKNYGAAVAPLTEAIQLVPKWWTPYRNLAAAQLALQDTAASTATYEAGVQATHQAELVADLAALYERQGRVDAAIRQYEVLHERLPHLDLAANNLAMLLVTYRTDRSSLDRARDLSSGFANSDNGTLLDTHGWVKFKRGEFGEALSALNKAAALSPDSKVIRYHLGMTQLKAGHPDEARTSLEAALAGAATFAGSDEARSALAQLKGRAG
jgi:tetratricopeptide (TPR) repeat protein